MFVVLDKWCHFSLYLEAADITSNRDILGEGIDIREAQFKLVLMKSG